MNRKNRLHRLTAALLAATLTLVLLPAAAQAAAAKGSASCTVGYSFIFVNLSEGAFADKAVVETVGNWTLSATGGSQTIIRVARTGDTSVTITLSGPVAAGNAFTLNALQAVFAEGTEPFSAALNVGVVTPNPAQGTAAAAAGTKDIALALTRGTFSNAANVEIASRWTLGGASAAGNPIAGVKRVDSTHVTITLTNNIGASDVYTVTATQTVFVNSAVAPFAAPLSVSITGGDTTPPAFTAGYPVSGAAQAPGSKQIEVLVRMQNTQGDAAVCYVLVPDGAGAPDISQIASGKDSAGAAALASGSHTFAKGAEFSFLVTAPEHGTAYDLYVLAGDAHYTYPYVYSSAISKLDVTAPASGSQDDPVVTTDAASGVGASSAQLSGNVVYETASQITERGFVIATHAEPVTGYDKKLICGSGTGGFGTTAADLLPDTVYYVRAYAIYSREVVYYGGEISFRTSDSGSLSPSPSPGAGAPTPAPTPAPTAAPVTIPATGDGERPLIGWLMLCGLVAAPLLYASWKRRPAKKKA